MRACRMAAIFVNMSKRDGEMKKRNEMAESRRRDSERGRESDLKWPIHLQCPCFIVVNVFNEFEHNVCVHVFIRFYILYKCTRSN